MLYWAWCDFKYDASGDNYQLRARGLMFYCYDTHISIMIRMPAALRNLTHWEPVPVRFQEQNLVFLLPWLGLIPQSPNSTGVLLENTHICQDTLM